MASTSNQNPTQAVIEKQQRLLENLGALESLIVALSGGADSAYLAWAAHCALGARALSVTALSPSYSAYDREQAESFLRVTEVQHEFVETHELEDPRYSANNADRCYHCKHELFSVLDRLAHQRNYAALAYGINADDTSDFRPGHRAAGEHRVLTPLLDVDLHKAEIRELSRQAGLPTWDRPASACLSSRVAYGIQVTPEILRRVEEAEAALRKLGFRQFRVRVHGDLARIEIAPEEMARAWAPETARTMTESLKQAGFAYVTLDLQGYRHGSMNEILAK